MNPPEARYYSKLDTHRVHCELCPQSCTVAPGKSGFCLARENHDGTLVAANYGQATSVGMDPIEKKPLYHFYPGRDILSIGSWGCNFKCSFCQNVHISQQKATSEYVSPQQAVDMARGQASIGIAYTYNEPLIGIEYVQDTARLAHEAGLKNVLVTNGFINPEPLNDLLPLIDALNVDIKAMRDDFYRDLCKGRVRPVLDTAVAARKAAHVEITNLIIPDYNDSREELSQLADWVASNLGIDTPVHLSAYFPRHRLRANPTPPETIEMAYDLFRQRLHFVYVGNIISNSGTNTACSSCGRMLVERRGYSVQLVGLQGSTCGGCGAANNIIS